MTEYFYKNLNIKLILHYYNIKIIIYLLNSLTMTSVQSEFMFTSGSSVYSKYSESFVKHKKGLLILGPPGIGKTYYCDNIQEENEDGKKHWIDADNICSSLNVQWHFNEKSKIEQRLNYLRAEYILEQSRALGYYVIGSLFWNNIIPDAIVIPDIELHKTYLKSREDLNIDFVLTVRKLLKDMAKRFDIKVFKSIQDAINYIC
jgi:hypothetical protein